MKIGSKALVKMLVEGNRNHLLYPNARRAILLLMICHLLN